MPESPMVSREEFANLVRDALANLYDPVHLQTHPLAGLLGLQHTSWSTVGEELRSLLRETIACLKPEASVPLTRPEWASYRVLWLHYVRLMDEVDAAHELSISSATFFRRQKEALDAVASILWGKYEQARAAAAASPAGPRATASPADERAHAISLAGGASPEALDVRELVDGAIALLQPLAEKQRVIVRADIAPALPAVYGEPALWRQIILSVFTESIRLWPESTLCLAVTLSAGALVCKVSGMPLGDVAAALARGFALSRDLLGRCHGRLWADEESAEPPALRFTLPAGRPQLILAIDDDPATIALYRRYLRNGPYVVLEAGTAGQAEARLAEARPDLVLLDVMMPQQDGWTLLRSLKSSPETAAIPIVVCSVIEQPELALALGAAAVLTKPIAPEQLLQAIQAHRPAADTTA